MAFVNKLFPRFAFHTRFISQAATCLTLLLALSGTVGTTTSFAQGTDEPLVCASLFDDPDGDGFGQVPLTNDSCIVTEETRRPPTYVNSRTGEPAQLIRAFWDGNADLIDRDIVCKQFSSSGETGFLFETRWYRFLAIPTGSTAGFYYAADTQSELAPDSSMVPFLWDWSIDYGRLQSESNLSFVNLGHFPGAYPQGASTDYFNTFSTPGAFPDTDYSYVEPFINEDGVQAIRFYETSGSLLNVFIDYTECSDASGQPFGPSGSPDSIPTAAPSPYIETATPFTGFQEPKPIVVNRETGSEVSFQTGTWDAQADFVDRTLTCTTYVYSDSNSG